MVMEEKKIEKILSRLESRRVRLSHVTRNSNVRLILDTKIDILTQVLRG